MRLGRASLRPRGEGACGAGLLAERSALEREKQMSGTAIPAAAVEAAAEAARSWLRAGAGEDAVLRRLAASAFAVGEAFTGVRFVARGEEAVVEPTGAWTPLPGRPVLAIAGVTGLPAAGVPFVLPIGAYAVDIDADGGGWVRIAAPGAAARVAVQYSAGLVMTWEELPAPLQQGVAMLAAHLHGGGGGALPAAVGALWRPWRRLALREARA
jgi:uncharacterized phiE125 gp8 family phage protein